MMRPARFAWNALILLAALGCDEAAKPKKAPEASTPEAAPVEVPAAPAKKHAPNFAIDEQGVEVGSSLSKLTDEKGKPNPAGLEQFKKDLASEKEFIDGKEIALDVVRLAKPEWVSTYVEELAALGATRIDITTETRSDFPKTVAFYAASRLQGVDKCSLVGAITADRGTALWRLSGGTARKRGKGMSGPDFSITSETLLSLKKKCDSDIFFTHGAEGVEWGPIYDFAAAARALPESGIQRASIPSQRPTLGRPVSLDY